MEAAGVEQGLIGRERESSALAQAIAAARAGRGGLVLLTGEAGIGKTRLARHALAMSGLPVLTGAAHPDVPLPYGPLVAALRSSRLAGEHATPPPASALSLLLAGRGAPPEPVDRAALFEALRASLAAIADEQSTIMFLDDLHWADAATLEVLPVLAGALEHEPFLLLGAYRDDEVPRGHPLRRMRGELRRAGRLYELALEPFGPEQTARLLTGIFNGRASTALTAAIHDRSEGVPFFVEELAAALAVGGRLRQSPAGFVAADTDRLPLPESISDAMLVRLAGFPEQARHALDVAAVAGQEFDIDLIVAMVGDETWLAEALRRGILIEVAPGRAAFRHALLREACYTEVVWTRRRALHRQVAARLEAIGAPHAIVAEHWLAGREPDRARPALIAAAEDARAVHAYRDACRALQHALEIWPDGAEETGRLAALNRLAQYAELCGDLAGATRAWGEALAAYLATDQRENAAILERSLAGVYELQGDWERALAAREAAADLFAACDLPAEAATEWLLAAAHLRSAAGFSAALALLDKAGTEADRAGRTDLQSRILGLTGNVHARRGEREAGLEMVRAGLALALAHNLAVPAAEIYQRLADSLEHAGDYAGAREMYEAGFAFCRAHSAPMTAQLCLACLTVVLRQTGEWERATALCQEVLDDPVSASHARAVSAGTLGMIHALRGRARRARPLLIDALSLARGIELVAMELLAGWGLAMVHSLAGEDDAAIARSRALLARWETTEECHYTVPVLHWIATFGAEQGAEDLVQASGAALARIVAATGQSEALAALSHTLGEVALHDGDPIGAAAHFSRALDLLRDRDLPFERALIGRRAGAALMLIGERETGIGRLTDAYRTARKLGARPLATQIAADLAALGEPVERHLGRGAAGRHAHGDLSRRELDVLRLVALGRTSREIGNALFVSPRTVDMHVEHLLRKLDCDTRAEAVRKGATLGLLA